MLSTSKGVLVNIKSLASNVANALQGNIETLTRVIHYKGYYRMSHKETAFTATSCVGQTARGKVHS